jgi:hypothetical protein
MKAARLLIDPWRHQVALKEFVIEKRFLGLDYISQEAVAIDPAA